MNSVEKVYQKILPNYAKAATVYQESARRLIERLDYMNISPEYILDVGCGFGTHETLSARYPNANIIGLDLSFAMLSEKEHSEPPQSVQALAEYLPIASKSVDLIFSSHMMQDLYEPKIAQQVLKEFYRVLRPGGLLLFTTIGPGSLFEIKKAFESVDTYGHVNPQIDLHNWGDMLLETHFQAPIMDAENITVHYPNAEILLKDVKNQGSFNRHKLKRRGLVGVDAWEVLLDAFDAQRLPNGRIPLTYEVIYGHAWRGEDKSQMSNNGEVSISLDMLRYRK